MHELLFHRQHALEDDHLQQYARQFGLDIARFDDDRVGREVLQRVARDVVSGNASGEVLGTPTLFINGRVHRGSYDVATLLLELATRSR
jgi:Na+:H+ antiporter, NhaA family